MYLRFRFQHCGISLLNNQTQTVLPFMAKWCTFFLFMEKEKMKGAGGEGGREFILLFICNQKRKSSVVP